MTTKDPDVAKTSGKYPLWMLNEDQIRSDQLLSHVQLFATP